MLHKSVEAGRQIPQTSDTVRPGIIRRALSRVSESPVTSIVTATAALAVLTGGDAAPAYADASRPRASVSTLSGDGANASRQGGLVDCYSTQSLRTRFPEDGYAYFSVDVDKKRPGSEAQVVLSDAGVQEVRNTTGDSRYTTQPNPELSTSAVAVYDVGGAPKIIARVQASRFAGTDPDAVSISCNRF